MRLFTGVELTQMVRENLDGLIRALRPVARIKWSPAVNLHITTKFIGEWPEERLKELIAALGELRVRGPIPIAITGLGWFPNPQAPRVFWAGVQAAPALADLARETEQRLRRLGVPAEERRFSPHLTLARIKEATPLSALRQAVAALPDTNFGEFTADHFSLFQSTLTPSGSEYKKLADFPLTTP